MTLERAAPRDLCAEIIRHGPNGPVEPRRCKVVAKLGEIYCGPHKTRRARRALVRSRDGGFCIWCAEPARSFESTKDAGVTIALCQECADALLRELECLRRLALDRRKR